MSVEQTGRAYHKLHGTVADGKKPAEERRDNRSLQTLADLHEFFVSECVRTCNKRSEPTQELWSIYLSTWAKTWFLAIKKSDVHALHTALKEKHGDVSANPAVQRERA